MAVSGRYSRARSRQRISTTTRYAAGILFIFMIYGISCTIAACSGGTVTSTTQWSTTYVPCTGAVTSDLVIDVPVSTLSAANLITSFRKLTLGPNSQIEHLDFFPSVTSAFEVVIVQNSFLQSIKFPNLSTLTDSVPPNVLVIDNLPSLTVIEIPSLSSCAAGIDIGGYAALTTLDIATGTNLIMAHANKKNIQLRNIAGISAWPTNIFSGHQGNMILSNWTGLTSLSGYSQGNAIGINIEDMPVFTTLGTASFMSDSFGRLVIRNNPALTTATAFPNDVFKNVVVQIEVSNNPVLTTITSFTTRALTVNQPVVIENNPSLTKFELVQTQTISTNVGGNSLIIEDCTSMTEVAMPALQSSNGRIIIRNNPSLHTINIASVSGLTYGGTLANAVLEIDNANVTSWGVGWFSGITGTIMIMRNFPVLNDLSNLNLGTMTKLEFHNLDTLTSFTGVSGTVNTLEVLQITNCYFLTDLGNFIPLIIKVPGAKSIRLENLDSLTSAGSNLDTITSMTGGVVVKNTGLQDLSMSLLTHTAGVPPTLTDTSIAIENNNNLETIYMPSLIVVGKDVRIKDNAGLHTMEVATTGTGVNCATGPCDIEIDTFRGEWSSDNFAGSTSIDQYIVRRISTAPEVHLPAMSCTIVKFQYNGGPRSVHIETQPTNSIFIDGNSQLLVARGESSSLGASTSIVNNPVLEALRFPNMTSPGSLTINNNPNLCCDDIVQYGGSATGCRTDNCQTCPDVYPSPQFLGPDCMQCACAPFTYCTENQRGADWVNPLCMCEEPEIQPGTPGLQPDCRSVNVTWYGPVLRDMETQRGCFINASITSVLSNIRAVLTNGTMIMAPVNTTNTWFDVQELQPGSNVTFDIRAMYDDGVGPSMYINHVVPAIHPGSPVILEYQGLSNSEVTVRWKASDQPCQETDAFEVYYKKSIDISWSYEATVPESGQSEWSHNITGLETGTAYNIRIVALFHGMANSTEDTTYTLLARPLNVNITDIQPDSFRVNWMDNPENSALGVSSYAIYIDVGDGPEFYDSLGHVPNPLSYEVSRDILPGHDYTVMVQAESPVTFSVISQPGSAFTAVIPETPVVQARAINSTHAELTWALLDTGGTLISSFRVYDKLGGSKVLVHSIAGLTELPGYVILGGLTVNSTYEFCVEPVNVMGSPDCDVADSQSTVYTHSLQPPVPVLAISGMYFSQGIVEVQWNYSSNPIEGGVTNGFQVFLTSSNTSRQDSWLPVLLGPEQRRFNITNRVKGSTTFIAIQAQTTGGSSMISSLFPITFCTAPGPPRWTTNVNQGAYLVAQAAPHPKNGGCPVTAYKLYQVDNGVIPGNYLQTYPLNGAPVMYAFPVDTTVVVYLTAVSSAGESRPGPLLQHYMTSIPSTLDIETKVQVLSNMTNIITITSKEPWLDNSTHMYWGGYPIRAYRLYDNLVSATEPVAQSPRPIFYHHVTNSNTSAPHGYEITGVPMLGGETPRSALFTAHHAHVPDPVSDIDVIPLMAGSVNLTWTSPNDYGFPVSYCTVYVSDDSEDFENQPPYQWYSISAQGTTWAVLDNSHPIFYDMGLRPDLPYAVAVTCTNEFGESLVSRVHRLTTTALFSPPGSSETRHAVLGRNTEGQLGLGHSRPVHLPTFVDFRYFYNQPISKVAIGDNFMLYTTSFNRVYGAGMNDRGQLGFDPAIVPSTTTPLRVPHDFGNQPLKTVHASGKSSFVVRAYPDRLLYSFGDNTYRKLGHSPDKPYTHLPNLVIIPSGFPSVDMGCTDEWCLAWNDEMNAFHFWGKNSLLLDKKRSATDVVFPALAITHLGDFPNWAVSNNPFIDISEVQFGKDHAVILFTSGDLFVLGPNTFGLAADGTSGGNIVGPLNISYSGSLPRPASNQFDEHYINSIVCGDGFTIIATLNRVFGWGRNDLGQLSHSLPTVVLTPTELTSTSEWYVRSGDHIKSVFLTRDIIGFTTRAGELYTRGLYTNSAPASALFAGLGVSNTDPQRLYTGALSKLVSYRQPQYVFSSRTSDILLIEFPQVGPYCDLNARGPSAFRAAWGEAPLFKSFEPYHAVSYNQPLVWTGLPVVNGSVHDMVVTGNPGETYWVQAEGQEEDGTPHYSAQNLCAVPSIECHLCTRVQPLGGNRVNVTVSAINPNMYCTNSAVYVDIGTGTGQGLCDALEGNDFEFPYIYSSTIQPTSLDRKVNVFVNQTISTSCPPLGPGSEEHIRSTQTVSCATVGVSLLMPAYTNYIQNPCSPNPCGTNVQCVASYDPQGASYKCLEKAAPLPPVRHPSESTANRLACGLIDISWTPRLETNYTLVYSFDEQTPVWVDIDDSQRYTLFFVEGQYQSLHLQIQSNDTRDRFEPHMIDLTSDCSNVGRVVTGLTHYCQLDRQQNILCWGENDQNQLGQLGADGYVGNYGGFEVSDAAQVPTLLPLFDNSDIVTLAAHEKTTCALRASGFVFCWGQGYPWDGTHGLKNNSPLPLWFADDRSPVVVRKIAMDLDMVCIVTDKKRGACWGSNDNGRLGLDEGSSVYPELRPSVTQPLLPIGIEGTDGTWTSLSPSRSGCIAITNSTVFYIWGKSFDASVGDEPGEMKHLAPVMLDQGRIGGERKLTYVRQYVAGHTFMIDDTGALRHAGVGPQLAAVSGLPEVPPSYNHQHFFIHGSNTPIYSETDGLPPEWHYIPYTTPTRAGGSQLNVSRFDLATKPSDGPGDPSICVVTVDGALWCWGSDAHKTLLGTPGAQLGLTPASMDSLSPITTIKLASHEVFQDIVAAYETMCAVTSFGRVVCWGAGSGPLSARLNATSVTSEADVGLLSSDYPSLHGYPPSCDAIGAVHAARGDTYSLIRPVRIDDQGNLRQTACLRSADGHAQTAVLMWAGSATGLVDGALSFLDFTHNATNNFTDVYAGKSFSFGLKYVQTPGDTPMNRKWTFSKPTLPTDDTYTLHTEHHLFPRKAADFLIDVACGANGTCVRDVYFRYCPEGYFPSNQCDDPCTSDPTLRGQFGLCQALDSSAIDSLFGPTSGSSESKVYADSTNPSRLTMLQVFVSGIIPRRMGPDPQ